VTERYVIGVDAGGTFTDVVIAGEDGRLWTDKAFSTPDDPARGVIAALRACAARVGEALPDVLAATGRLAHGTTVGTNALIQRRGARTGLLMTRGFEDTTLITRGPMGRNVGVPASQAMDYVHNDRPPPLVPPALIRGVTERVAPDGEVVARLDEDEAARMLGELAAAGAESIAVCLLWSFRNDAHERRVAELARALLPDVPVHLSSRVSPQMGEFERATTTVVNAYLGPIMERYLGSLQRSLQAEGLGRPVQLMSCSGGVVMPHDAGRQAVMLVNSGPVGGLVAARRLGERLGLADVVTTDMGGTSFDVGVIHGGELETEQRPCLDQGLPVQVPAVRVVTIGAGGGSIARARDGRLLVGPDSAGAVPGPACYGAGGVEPTVTDALVVLGVIDPGYFLGGRKRLDPELAVRAVRERVAEPLGMTVHEAAAGIHHIVTARMADLIRKVTIESGHDPRQFTVFAYGGASPAHAALYAEAVGAREVVVPAAGSVFSALGCACSDLKYAYAQARPMPLRPDAATIAAFNETFRVLEERALADLERLGPPGADAVLTRRVDLRYEGQLNELTVPWVAADLDADRFGDLRGAFEAGYESRFGSGTTRSASPMEAVTFRVEALLRVPDLAAWSRPLAPAAGGDARKGSRLLHLRGLDAQEAAVYEADRLAPGATVEGPAIVERPDTTVLVPPGHLACLDDIGNLRISVASR